MKKAKKVLALILVGLLAVSILGACGKKQGANQQGNKGSSGTGTANNGKTDDNESGGQTSGDDMSDQNTSEDDWTWPLPEKKEISIWTEWNNDYLTDPSELKGIQKIEEMTNVHVNWMTCLDIEAREKFGLMIASGNYPDILRKSEEYYVGGLSAELKDGVIIDMTEYIDQYMPIYTSIIESNEKLKKDVMMDDHRMIGIYILSTLHGELMGEYPWDGMGIRKDWLDELNMEVPETIDDWHEALTAFKNTYQCEAPLMIGFERGYDYCNSFLTAYGVLGEFYRDGNTVKYGPLEEGYKQWVQLFHDWYAEGLIDPNFITSDTYMRCANEMLGTGRAGAGPIVWSFSGDYYLKQGIANDPDFWMAAAPAPVLNEGDTPQLGRAMSDLTKETIAITSNCKDIELACRFMDFMYSDEAMMCNSLGIEGESYIVNSDGSYSMSPAVTEAVESGEYPSIGAYYLMYSIGASGFGKYDWGRFLVQNEGLPSLNAYEVWAPSRYDLVLPTNLTMTVEESNIYGSAYVDIDTLVKENTLKFITGTRPMEEYDQFVEDIRTYKIEECLKIQQAALDRYNAR